MINTVGFLVDDEARAELECIAEVGGGQYVDANDADIEAFSTTIFDLGNPLNATTNAHSQSWSIPVEDGEKVALSMVTAQPPSAGGRRLRHRPLDHAPDLG